MYMSCVYVICLYTFTGYLKNTNENFQKIHAILLTTLHLKEMNDRNYTAMCTHVRRSVHLSALLIT
jgi:hypothetical protein